MSFEPGPKLKARPRFYPFIIRHPLTYVLQSCVTVFDR